MVGLFLVPLATWNARAIVPVMAIAALAVLYHLRGTMRACFAEALDRPFLLFLFGFLVVVFAAGLHGDDAVGGLLTALKVLGSFVIAVVLWVGADQLRAVEVRVVLGSVLVGVVAVGAFFAVDVLSDGWLSLALMIGGYTPKYQFFWFKAGATVLTVAGSLAAFFLAVSGRTVVAILLVLAIAMIVSGIGSKTGAVGLVASLIAGVVFHLAGHMRKLLVTLTLAAVFAFPILSAPLGFSADKISETIGVRRSETMSFVYRMHIWEFVGQRIAMHPITGWGLDASKTAGTKADGMVDDPVMGILGERVPSHPHNAPVHIWFETGAFGALFAFLFLNRALRLFAERLQSGRARVFGIGFVFTVACFASFSFSAWSSWWLALLGFTGALAGAVARLSNERSSHVDTKA